jgi:hypothetical protein
MKKFPKAWSGGHRNVGRIWDGPVEITEKIDGSQIGFGWMKGELYVRSKNHQIHEGSNTMFTEGYEHISRIAPLLPDNVMFYGEYLKKPKHNTLEYGSVPRNHIALFGIIRDDGTAVEDHGLLVDWAKKLDIGWVPLLDYCEINTPEQLLDYMGLESYLGGPHIEGVVIKNYAHDIVIGGEWCPFIQMKHVSEAFKEKHIKGWKKSNNPGKFQTLKEAYRSEARWKKAMQSLRDDGTLSESPRDIGPLLKYINQDIIEEEQENIKEALWNIFRKEILRHATMGFPEWYKEELLKMSFEKEVTNE